MLLKHYLGQRVSKTDLARRPGVDRRTIHNRVRPGQLNPDVSAFSARAGGLGLGEADRPRPPRIAAGARHATVVGLNHARTSPVTPARRTDHARVNIALFIQEPSQRPDGTPTDAR